MLLRKMNDTAKLNKYVQLLPLPDSSEDVEPGTLCQVAGWGDTSSGTPSEHLQEATLKIHFKPHLCTAGGTACSSEEKWVHADSYFCFVLQGDSGGPLICAGQYRGIVSFGKKKCGKRGIPGVYTQLTEKYVDWIKRTISRNREP
uniref:Peptidase S1 domain-containing protein n=1 Tax=Malurus cyaneus samueli TaxID=2593467 RepID=A0A8C5TAA9_9PASS